MGMDDGEYIKHRQHNRGGARAITVRRDGQGRLQHDQCDMVADQCKDTRRKSSAMSFPGTMPRSNMFSAGKLASGAIVCVLCAQPLALFWI